MERREHIEAVQSSDKNEARRASLSKKLFAAGAGIALAGSLAACGSEANEAPESGTQPTVEAPVVPGEPEATAEPVETEPTVGSLEFRESDLTPDVLASLSDSEIIERMQIPVAEFPTAEAWAEQYVLRDNDVMRSGTAPSEITASYDKGTDAMYAIVDRYAGLSAQALKAGAEQYEASDVLRVAVLNASQAHNLGETYIIREDLESVEVTAGSVEEGTFSANLVMRRQDNMGELEATKTRILDDSGNVLRTLSADVNINMRMDVANIDGLWKASNISIISSTPHEK